MDKKLKIAFIWYFDKAGSVFDNWRDGLRSALEEIEKKHRVDWYLNKKIPQHPEWYDFILVWDDSNTETTKLLPKSVRKGLCLTTDPTNVDNLKNFDVVFCESQPVFDQARANGLHAIKAFGTDTDFFKPGKKKREIEYFYPATFSPWKRQSQIACLSKPVLFVGTIQPDGIGEYEAVIKEGRHKVEVGYFPVEKIKDYYQRSKKVVIPAIHGSERTILEAMACDIKPILLPDGYTSSDNKPIYTNVKALSYLSELEESGLSPRDFVVKNYSHKTYAKQLLKGIEG